MGRGPTLAPEEVGRVRGLAEAGFSNREIAARVGRSKGAVAAVLKTKNDSMTEPMGRPTSLNERMLRQVVRTAATGDYTAAQLKDMLYLPCSVRTVRRILSRVDFL
ncbi:hypothetical protein ACHHYP_07149, partial [Achlya hypogyna]